MKNLSKILKHIIVPMATPFKKGAQEVDCEVAEKLIDNLITKRLCDSILITGTTGEFNTLSR